MIYLWILLQLVPPLLALKVRGRTQNFNYFTKSTGKKTVFDFIYSSFFISLITYFIIFLNDPNEKVYISLFSESRLSDVGYVVKFSLLSLASSLTVGVFDFQKLCLLFKKLSDRRTTHTLDVLVVEDIVTISPRISKVSKYIAVAHWFISFFSDRIFFDHSAIKSEWKLYFFLKLVLVPVLFYLWKFIFSIPSLLKHDTTKVTVRVGIAYFSLMMLVLSITWPGIWGWDEAFVVNNTRVLKLNYWQNFITSIFYILSAMIIPSVGGILIVQNIIISIILSYVFQFVRKDFHKNCFSYIFLFTFLSPSTIYQNIYPLRATLCGYFELLFIVVTIELLNGKFSKNIHLFLTLYVLLGSVIGTWRSESIVYLVIVPTLVLMYKIKCQNIRFPSFCVYLLMSTTLILLSTEIQNNGSEIENRNRGYGHYNLTAVVSPLGYIYKNVNNLDHDLLINLEQMIDTELFYQYSRPVDAFWDVDFMKISNVDLEDELLSDAMDEIFSLFLRYPLLFLENRLNLLEETIISAYPGSRASIHDHISNNFIFLDNAIEKMYPSSRLNFIETLRNYISASTENNFINVFARFTQFIVPFITIFLYFIYCFFKKRWDLFVICSIPCSRFLLVFLTAPSHYFMYYFPVYLVGMSLCMYIIVHILTKLFSMKPVGAQHD